MLHQSRIWGVSLCDNAELVAKLQNYSWTLCSAFKTLAGTIWANDSTCADAIQEYAVFRPSDDGEMGQVESITVSWCKAVELKKLIETIDQGEYDSSAMFGTYSAQRFESDHSPCCHCR